ncbi:MAG: bifunctional DNA-formamidopyrimidine glycosylase/DNA-(apurinic or apyrimidinic site) lyase [Planctomycetota bacterium]
MPELPEVETIRRGLYKNALGLKIKDVAILLPKIINTTPMRFRNAVIGKTILNAQRRAKVIIIELSGDYALVIHLKISGQLLYLPKTTPIKKHTHIVFNLSNKYQLRFWDQRQFGYVRVFKKAEMVKFIDDMEFGPEPLEKTFTLNRFRGLLKKRSNGRIKPLLMDPKFISGIGNLYADEILFYAKVHPLRKPSSLTDAEINKIYQGIKKILDLAIKKRGSSVELYVDVEGRPGGYVPYIKAYNREEEPCLRCRAFIKRIKIGSRSAYFCPHCQSL